MTYRDSGHAIDFGVPSNGGCPACGSSTFRNYWGSDEGNAQCTECDHVFEFSPRCTGEAIVRKPWVDPSDLVLNQTCWMCPEQYDVYHDGRIVGYMRLRGGYFRAECPVGTVVYRANPRGDGSFESDERDKYLGEAKSAIAAQLSGGNVR